MNAYIRELDRETALIEKSKSTWARSPLAQTIIQETEVIKSLAVHEAGTLARKRLQRVVNELSELISQIPQNRVRSHLRRKRFVREQTSRRFRRKEA